MTNRVYKIYIIEHKDKIKYPKVYIGQTWKSLKERFRQHCNKKDRLSLITNAVNKYCKDNFTIKELAICYNQKDADSLEIGFIREYRSFGYGQKYGYNLTAGGKGHYIYGCWNNLCIYCCKDILNLNKSYHGFCDKLCYVMYKTNNQNGSKCKSRKMYASIAEKIKTTRQRYKEKLMKMTDDEKKAYRELKHQYYLSSKNKISQKTKLTYVSNNRERRKNYTKEQKDYILEQQRQYKKTIQIKLFNIGRMKE